MPEKNTAIKLNYKQTKTNQNMKKLIETLRKRNTSSYGRFVISIEIEGETLKTTTTNTMAIDTAFDDCYDDHDNTGNYYESQKEAQIELINEILRNNEI